MSRVVMLATNGFEEIEAVSVIDILRRARIQCDLCSVIDSDYLEGSHNIVIKADLKLCNFNPESYDAVVLPGGMPGSDNLRDSERVIDILRDFDKKGKIVSAICAAPKALERAGLLNGKKVTFYPKSIENESGLIYTGGNTERDGNIITGKAAGAAAGFAFELIKALKSKELAEEVKAKMFY